ncbi:MAG: IS1380 family transposase [Elusimicrobiota bacterium]
MGGEGMDITFTRKAVTPWGGLVLFSGMARQIGLEQTLRKALPFQVTSPNATDPVEIVLAFMTGVLVGSRRLAHIERLRWDEGVHRILGIKRFVSDTTLGRFFKRFKAGTVNSFFEALMLWQLTLITLKEEILDLDSSIFERYGHQEGAWLGYNPKKHRRPSHHPLIATLGQRPWIVHAWLRSGNTTSARGADAFLDETLALLPDKSAIRYLRADSGFGVEPFLKKVEDMGLIYAIVARFTQGLKNLVGDITGWRELEPGIAVSEVLFQAHGWSRARRVVLIRQRRKERDFVRGRELFDDPGFLYQAILTNRTDAPEEVWRFYRGHAEVESRIRELKWDYGVDGFCQKRFFPTEAAFRLVCVTYNLVSLLQEKLGSKVYQTLGTIRAQLFACGALVGRSGRRIMLRLSLAGPWRDRFENGLKVFFPSTNGACDTVGSG